MTQEKWEPLMNKYKLFVDITIHTVKEYFSQLIYFTGVVDELLQEGEELLSRFKIEEDE